MPGGGQRLVGAGHSGEARSEVTKVEIVVGGHWDGAAYQTMAAPQTAPRAAEDDANVLGTVGRTAAGETIFTCASQ